MLYLSHIRQRYGDAFVTILPDGRQVPWRPLTIGEYLKYNTQITTNAYPLGCIHDEIFKLCVLDKQLVSELPDLPAGIVTSVSISILNYGGPKNVNDLAEAFSYARASVQQIFPQIISTICWAFPSYTPDDLYKLDYYTLMERLALAESKLAKLGLLTQPISFGTPEEVESKTPSKAPERPKPPKKEEVFEQLKVAYQKENIPSTSIPRPKKNTNQTQQTIVSQADIQETKAAYTNHERSDSEVLELKMVEESAGFYKDYLDQLKKDGKITIKTDEERKAEAFLRAKKNEEYIKKVDAQRKIVDQQELEKLTQKKVSRKEQQLNARNKKRR